MEPVNGQISSNGDLPALPPKEFISREQTIGKLPDTARLISADLMPLGAVQDKYEICHEASPEKMTWVVKVAYPDGIRTRGGFYANATQTCIRDAQTGQLLGSITTGTLGVNSVSRFRRRRANES